MPVYDARVHDLEFPNHLPPVHFPQWKGEVPPDSVALAAFTVNSYEDASGKDPEVVKLSHNILWLAVLEIPKDFDSEYELPIVSDK